MRTETQIQKIKSIVVYAILGILSCVGFMLAGCDADPKRAPPIAGDESDPEESSSSDGEESSTGDSLGCPGEGWGFIFLDSDGSTLNVKESPRANYGGDDTYSSVRDNDSAGWIVPCVHPPEVDTLFLFWVYDGDDPNAIDSFRRYSIPLDLISDDWNEIPYQECGYQDACCLYGEGCE